MNWNEYHKRRQVEFFKEHQYVPVSTWTDERKIAIAEARAVCYHPRETDGWETRKWLESIFCVKHHGCCNGCPAIKLCV